MIQVLSPDGFTIDYNFDHYPSMAAANKAFQEWKDRYKQQGYYSSKGEKIPLTELKKRCQFNHL
jgi:hypothetical protein